MKIYLYLWDTLSDKKFFKYFDTEYEMDKFKRKLQFSKKLVILEDSREMMLSYDR